MRPRNVVMLPFGGHCQVIFVGRGIAEVNFGASCDRQWTQSIALECWAQTPEPRNMVMLPFGLLVASCDRQCKKIKIITINFPGMWGQTREPWNMA